MTERAKGARRSPEAKAEYLRDKLKKAEEQLAVHERNLDTRCKVIVGASILSLVGAGDAEAQRVFERVKAGLGRQQDQKAVNDWLAGQAKKRPRASLADVRAEQPPSPPIAQTVAVEKPVAPPVTPAPRPPAPSVGQSPAPGPNPDELAQQIRVLAARVRAATATKQPLPDGLSDQSLELVAKWERMTGKKWASQPAGEPRGA